MEAKTKTKIIDIYSGGILDGNIKEWCINTYIMLNSYNMEYNDDMFPTEIRHSYGFENKNIDVYELARKQDEEDYIKCFYTYKGNVSSNDFDEKIQSIMAKKMEQ